MRLRFATTILACLPPLLAPASTNTVRSVSEALKLAVECNDHVRTFDLTGTSLSDARLVTPFHDGTGGMNIERRTTTNTTWKAGDRLRVRGDLVIATDGHLYAQCRQINVIGHEPLPDPILATGGEIADGKRDFTLVRIRGVIESVEPDMLDERYVNIALRTPSASIPVPVEVSMHPLNALRKLVDAEVECAGLVIRASGWRQLLCPYIAPFDADGIKVLKDAPEDPFAAPPFSDNGETHRQRMSGTAVAVGSGRFLLRTANGKMVVVNPVRDTSVPEPGAPVVVSGFAAQDPLSIRLTEALVRTADAGTQIPAEQAPAVLQRLITRRNDTINHDVVLRGDALDRNANGRLIRIRGKVCEPPNEASDTFLRLQCEGSEIMLDTAVWNRSNHNPPPEGCLLEVVGYCLVELTNYPPLSALPRFRGFTIIPRTLDDVTVLSRPPWWTVGRLAAAVAGLSVLLTLILCWNASLRRLAERRGRQIYREQLVRARSELQIQERTRLAIELHDSISQSLTGVSMQIDSAERLCAIDAHKTQHLLRFSSQAIDACRKELRDCIWDLRSDALSAPNMNEAIRKAIQQQTGAVKLSIRFNVPRNRLSDNTAHGLLRIVRELTTNAMRHGKATSIKIAGTLDSSTLCFSVTDDGIGFDAKNRPGIADGHFGLRGIEERVKKFNGKLDITSVIGNGTRVVIELPVRKANQTELS